MLNLNFQYISVDIGRRSFSRAEDFVTVRSSFVTHFVPLYEAW